MMTGIQMIECNQDSQALFVILLLTLKMKRRKRTK